MATQRMLRRCRPFARVFVPGTKALPMLRTHAASPSFILPKILKNPDPAKRAVRLTLRAPKAICAARRGLDGRAIGEESPDSTRQRCRVTPGRGNPRDSATENRPPTHCFAIRWVRVKRRGKSSPRPWQQGWHGKPHREQCRIGTARAPVKRVAGTSWPSGPGWQLEGIGQPVLKMNGHPRGKPLDRIRLTGPLRLFSYPD